MLAKPPVERAEPLPRVRARISNFPSLPRKVVQIYRGGSTSLSVRSHDVEVTDETSPLDEGRRRQAQIPRAQGQASVFFAPCRIQNKRP